MATFYDRLFWTNDYDTDGGAMSSQYMRPFLVLYVWGQASAAQVKSGLFCTGSGQENDVQDILDTCPTSLLSTLGAVNRACWVDRVCAAVDSVYNNLIPGLNSEAEFKAALGI